LRLRLRVPLRVSVTPYQQDGTSLCHETVNSLCASVVVISVDETGLQRVRAGGLQNEELSGAG